MKTLVSFNIARLLNLEFIQFIRDNINDISNSGVTLLETDVPLKTYLQTLTVDIDPYEMAIKNPQKNPYTEQLVEKDKTRDYSLSRFGRKLKYSELSHEDNEQKAYNTLNGLWKIHRGNAQLNRKAQTSATDNLLNDLAKEPYASAVQTLGLQPEIEAIRISNNDFRTLADDKRTEQAAKEYFDAKQMRTSLTTTCKALVNYVLALANAYPDNEEWDKLLKAINVVRKNYADMLGRRK